MEPVPLTIRSPTLAPGARVVVRDAEWVVRRVDSTPDGGSQLVCDGVSELVREREAVFLTRLEPQIEVLDPARTRLVRDESPQFADSRLYMESLLRQAAPSDDHIHAGHLGAMDSVAYQLEPARQALRQPRQRILIADAVGLGKTLEAGVLVSELIARGRGRRILVLALKSMLTQFQKEFWNRFTIPLTRLDSVGIQRVRRRIPTSHNPFHYYDKSIISIDTLKQDREYRTYLEQAYWDVIVIDEAHNVADRGTGSLRSRLARLLARRSDTLIMLTATPHDGKARSFASLVNMLDATAITDPEDYRREDFRDKGLVIRRFKKDIRADVRDAFRDREVHRSRFPASEKEERAYEALLAVKVARAGRARASAGLRAQASGGALTGSGAVASGGALANSEAVASGGALAGSEAEATDLGADAGGQDRRDLFSVTLEKALFSSPAACLATVDNRIRRRERELNQRTADGTGAAPAAAAAAEVGTEVTSLRALRDALAVIGPRDYAKYQALLDAIRGGRPFRWKASGRGAAEDRLVVFTERIETLRWLRKHLAEDLGLASAQVAILHGTMSDVDQQRVVEDFGNAKRPVRLLLCSDVASEGINLHYHCHRLIHFDMPWSLMVFQQRNGRVDRYGQKRRPQIVYLVAESRNKRIRGDTRILEILQAKDEQAYKNIGDPATFMNVHDVSAEEEITAKAMAEGEEADAFDARHQPKSNKAEDLLALFLGTAGGSRQGPGEQGPATDSREPAPERGPPAPPLSLFADDLAYCEQALHRLRRRNPALRFDVDADSGSLTLDAPDDLLHRFDPFPREVVPQDGRFRLTTDRERIGEAIVESRRDEHAWPKLHYLWRLNPVVGWLNDRMLAAFGRHQAPVVTGVPQLADDEAVFVLSGMVPNRKSHPLVHEWVAVTFRGGKQAGIETFQALLDRTGLKEQAVPNRNIQPDLDALQKLLPGAVQRAKEWLDGRRQAFEDRMDEQLNRELAALEGLKARRIKQLALKLERSQRTEAFKAHQRSTGERKIEEIFDDYLEWVEDTMTLERQPYIKVVCVMVGGH